jgi:hypothetical protein
LIKKHEIKKLSSFDFTPKIYDEDTFNKYYWNYKSTIL